MKPGLISWGAFLLVFTAALYVQSGAPLAPPLPSVPKGGPWHAFEWWYNQRAYPGALIPQSALKAGHEFVRAARIAKGAPRSPSSSPSQWTSIGPWNIGGRVLSIAVHPHQTSSKRRV